MALRLANYLLAERPDLPPRVGALAGEGLIDVAEACEEMDAECGCTGSVLALLCCPDCLAMVREALAGAEPHIALDAVKLLAPVPRPGKLFCLAGNYEEHIREGGRQEVHGSDRATPRVFMKPVPNTVCGQGDPIPVARTTQFLDYEGELAVIIGKGGKYIPAAEALDYVCGATCLNDVSERRLHVWDRPEDRPWDRFFDWLNGKWYDNFAPMGPCAVPLPDLGDVQDLRLVTRVNGETVQNTSTAQMIFTVAQQIEYISHMLTLEPGDVIATGTPAGVGIARGVPLQAGDVVEVEVEGIGVLRNPVAPEP
ncbi:fumarylacetoacetate hydrolase family protein [bacterium]|nr:fumarylacetoacetate hydrolase family protein [bacterium]